MMKPLLRNRILTVLLTLALTMSLLSAISAPAKAATTPDTTWYDGVKPEFTLTTAAELLGLAQLVNDGNSFAGKAVLLGGNIDLSGEEWIPIGACTGGNDAKTVANHPFEGIFDGQNYVISNLTIASPGTAKNKYAGAGLFGSLSGEGAVVGNVALEDVKISAAGYSVGAISGILQKSAVIENCSVSGVISGGDSSGGIVGRLLVNGSIKNCTNNAVVTSDSGKAAGIVASAYYNEDKYSMVIEGCVNNGVITGKGYTGGIAGLSCANISNCVNTGSVTSLSGTSVGGIVGEQQNAGSITGCWNTGNVTNNAVAYGTGGIVGWIRYSGTALDYPTVKTIVVSECVNTGDVESKGTGVGGVAGTVYCAAKFINCRSFGDSVIGGDQVGGFIGSYVSQTTGTSIAANDKCLGLVNNISTVGSVVDTAGTTVASGFGGHILAPAGSTYTDKWLTFTGNTYAEIPGLGSCGGGAGLSTYLTTDKLNPVEQAAVSELIAEDKFGDDYEDYFTEAGTLPGYAVPITYTFEITASGAPSSLTSADNGSFAPVITCKPNGYNGAALVAVLNINGKDYTWDTITATALQTGETTLKALVIDRLEVGIYDYTIRLDYTYVPGSIGVFAPPTSLAEFTGSITVTSGAAPDIVDDNVPEPKPEPIVTSGGSSIVTSDGQKPVDNGDGTITLPAGGTVTLPGEEAVTIDAPAGTIVDENGGVTIPDGKTAEIKTHDATVTIPGGSKIDSDGTITIGTGTADVTISNGSHITVSTGTVIKGDHITVGYAGASAVIDDEVVNYTDGTVLILDEETPLGFYVLDRTPFSDVDETDWFYSSVIYVYENGLMVGMSDEQFNPNAIVNRSMLVTVLWRLADEPAPEGENTFDDLTQSWYFDAVIWASENDIVKGYDDGGYGPEDGITREQLATILYRYAGFTGMDVSAGADLGEFSDADEISDYAYEAMSWAYKSGLIKGRTESTLAPLGTASRAELSVILQRFLTA